MISVIVINLNTRDLLRECLGSVIEEAARTPLEIIVVDNASSDGSVEMVRNEFPSVQLIVNTTNEGFARPNNKGMQCSSGDFVFLLNSDARLTPGSLQALESFMKQQGDAGACGPMLVYPDGRLQKSVKGFPTLWTHTCDMTGLDRLFSRTRLFGRGEMGYFSYQSTAEVDHVMAAAFLVRRAVIMQTGMLDDQFRIYYNDMDWCYRMKQAGWKIFYVPAATVVHHLGRTVEKINRDFAHFEELHNNVMLFYQKHYGRWSVPLYKALLFVGYVPRTILWSLRRPFSAAPEVATMCTYSWKTLGLGLTFWKPLRTISS